MDSEKKISIADSIYNTLKKRILNLEYKPGRSLSVATLAQELEVSRSPVRDALLRLSREDLVDIFPQSGSRVSLINIHRTEEERFVRKSLEIEAIKKMFFNYSSTYLDKMNECIMEQEKLRKEEDLIDFLNKDGEFHRLIFSSIDKEDCWTLIENFSPNEFRVRVLATKILISTTENIIQNHKDLLNAINNRNLDAALDIEKQHLGRISMEIIALLRALPDIFELDDKGDINQVPAKIREVSLKNENYLDSLGKINFQ